MSQSMLEPPLQATFFKIPALWLLGLIIALAVFALTPGVVSCQTPVPDFNSGWTPYQTYQGGDIDSVDMATGSLNLHIPLISFPQRGGRLRLNFVLNYNSTTVARARIGTGGNTYYQWSPSDTNDPSVVVLDDQAYGIYYAQACQPNPPCGHGTQTYYRFFSVLGFDGAQHVMGYTSGSPTQTSGAAALRSMDSTGLYLTIPDMSKWGSNSTIYDESGNQYNGLTYSNAGYGPQFGVYVYPNTSRKDTNGNTISFISGTYTDTVGRSIPAPPLSNASTNNTDTTGCTGPLPITKAVLWQVPGYNGQQYPIKFCYATGTINVQDDASGPDGGELPDGFAEGSPVLQSVVLPNAQTLSFSSGTTVWEFEYNDQDGTNGCSNVQLTGPCQFGTLSKVTFPTGGSISYTYQMYGDDAQLQRAVRTRTVSDGTTSNTWTYTYTLPSSTNNWLGTTVVTASQMPYDSQPNDTVYTVSETWGGHFDTVFVIQTDYYQGSHSSGTGLKTVAKSFSFFTNPYFQVNVGGVIAQGLGSLRVGQQLNSETTTLSNSQVSQTAYTYDPGFTVIGLNGSPFGTFPYGLTTQLNSYDYGSGARGAPLKQVGTSYYWQPNPNYLTANLLSIPASVTTWNGAGTQAAQTTYAYDQNNGSPQGILGNNTSVTRWLNTGTSPTTYTVYNTQGMPVQKIDARGKVTQITYDTSTGAFPKQIQYPTTAGIAHIEQFSYDTNTGVLNTYIDQNNKSTNYQYDYTRRPTQVIYPDGGKTILSYNDAPLPATFTVSKLLNTSNQYATTTTTVDGVGRTIETLLTTDPDCPSGDRTDTTYDGLGRVSTISNPYCVNKDITTYEYDALGRTTLVIPPDGTITSNNVSTVYNGNCSTVTDQASNSRKSCADGLGRLVEVDEPGTTSLPVPLFTSAIVQGSENSIGLPTPGTGTVTLNSFNSNGTVQSKQVQTQAPAAGTGWATVNGSEQSITSQAASGSGTVTITGTEQSKTGCTQVVGQAQPQTTCKTYDHGAVSITVNGFTKSASYGVSSTPTTIATALASAFSGDSSSPVTATASSGVVTLKAKTTGFSTNYSLSTSSTWDNVNFGGPSFTGTPSGSTLTGGANGGTTYDTGSVWITVNGVQSSASYGQGSTTATVASALVSAINNNSSAPVSAALSGSTVNLTAKTTGAGTNYSLTAGSSTSQPSIFSHASFTVSLSGAALAGGRDAAYTTIYDYGTCTITVNSHADSSSWSGSGTTASTIVSSLISSINADSGAFVTASPSGTTVNLTSKSTGANTNYPLSSSCTYDSNDFSSPSFTTSNSGSTLSGGSNSSGSTIYDSGSVWIALNGTPYTASYGQNDTSTSVATSLANVLNASSPVTATVSGSTITITAKTGDAVTNYTWTASSSTNQPGYFNSPSFTPVVGVVSGSAPPSLSLSTPAITTYTYDALNNLLGVVQSGSRQRSFTYDSLSRLICASNPENSTAFCPATATSNYTPGTTGYSYDANGNLISKTSPLPNQSLTANTVAVTYVPDDLNRVTQKSFSDGTPSITYVYDGASTAACTLPSVNYGLAIGMRTGMCDAAGSEAWGYTIQSAGWQTQDVRITQGIQLTTTVQKNVDGSLNSLTYPSSRVVSYTYNGAARPITGNDSTGINYVSSADYWPSGALAALTNGTSNLYSTFILNSRLQPCWIYATTGTALSWNSTSCTSSTSTGNVLDLKYNFNLNTADNGNVAGITNNRDSNRSLTFAYDPLNRLTTAQTTSTYSTSASRCGAQGFAYDPWGNLLSKAFPFTNYAHYLGCAGESPFGFNISTNNQIQNSPSVQCFNNGALNTTAAYCYDAAGNLMADNTGASHYYDAENHLKSLPTLAISYLYDGDGRRVAKLNSSGQAIKLYWYGIGSDPLDETDGTGATNNTAFFEYAFFGGKRIARRNFQNTVYYYVADHLGTARATVQAGQTTACYDADFYPFGGERVYTDTCDSAYKFTGKERDSESGLDNFGARYNSSSMGRFMTVDPSNVSIERSNPQSWNRYSYVLNNPLVFVDQNGKWPTKIHEQIIDKAFPGLSPRQRAVLKSASLAMDASLTSQLPSNAYQHSMRAPSESPDTAKQKTQDFIHTEEHLAQVDQKTTPSSTSEINDKSLSMFGNAAHTVADETSPAHVDAQGNPLPWNPFSLSGVEAHEAAESTITPEQMNNAVTAVRQAFQDTYGQPAAQQAATPPPTQPCTADKDKKCP